MKRGNKAILAVACAWGMLGVAPGHAALLSLTNFTEAIVDGTTATRTVTFATAGTVLDVNVTIDFIKCQGTLPTPLPSDCGTFTGAANAREISFTLISPAGTPRDLVQIDTYFPSDNGPAPGARIQVTFSDDPVNLGDPVPDPVGGPAGTDFVSGTFQPVGLLSFPNEDVQGVWTLLIGDDVGGDELGVASFRLDVALQDAPPAGAPEPATALLLGFGLAGLAAVRRRSRQSFN